MAINYVKKTDRSKIMENIDLKNKFNKFVFFAYLWIFNQYVVHVCIDDEETKIAYDEQTIQGDDTKGILVPTHKEIYLLFNRIFKMIQSEDGLPFLLTDLEQVFYLKGDYMGFTLEGIKEYVLRDNNINIINGGSFIIEEVDDKSKESIMKLIDEINTECQAVESTIVEKSNDYEALFKYLSENKLTRYGSSYMYNDYLEYLSNEDKTTEKSPANASKKSLDAEVNVGANSDSEITPQLTQGGKNRKKTRKNKIIKKRRRTKKYPKSMKNKNNKSKKNKKSKKTKKTKKSKKFQKRKMTRKR